MTIVVYSHGVIAADDMITDLPDGNLCGRTIKVAFRKKDGALIGGCGSLAGVSEFLRKARIGRPSKAKGSDEFTGVIAFPDGLVQEWNHTGGMCEFRCDHYAIGTGALMARGALAAGADSVQAARIVCASYGWPADIHTFNHDGHFQVFQRVELPCHDSARITELQRTSRPARRPRSSANRKPAGQTRRRKHR